MFLIIILSINILINRSKKKLACGELKTYAEQKTLNEIILINVLHVYHSLRLYLLMRF